jgi:CheY-like chemotaxis protein
MHTTTAKIMYIDDDGDDCFFLSESLGENGLAAELVCAADGEEAVQQLEHMPNAELPSLIILDINMPRWDGRQTLSYLKNSERLHHIPVVILSTSENRFDQEVFRGLGAVSYFKKPFHYDGYQQIIKKLMPLLPQSA